jgi:ribulose kinase
VAQVADAPALGSAILAAVAAGLYPDVPAACARMVHEVGEGVGCRAC